MPRVALLVLGSICAFVGELSHCLQATRVHKILPDEAAVTRWRFSEREAAVGAL